MTRVSADLQDSLVPPILRVDDIAISRTPIIPLCRCGSPLVLRTGEDLERCEACAEWTFNSLHHCRADGRGRE